jgi:hypothetical protein
MYCVSILLTNWDYEVRITSQPIQVVGEYPKYSFKKGEIVVVVADDNDLFWIAEVTDADNK